MSKLRTTKEALITEERRRLVRKFVEKNSDLDSLKLLVDDPNEENMLSLADLSQLYSTEEKSSRKSTPILPQDRTLFHPDSFISPTKSSDEKLIARGSLGPLVTDTRGSATGILHIAAQHNNVSALTYFLGLGIDPALEDGRGNTCLHIAVDNRFVESVMAILTFIRRLSPEGRRKVMNKQNNKGMTVFHLRQPLTILEKLIEEGAGYIDLNIVCKDGYTPLHQQAQSGLSRENVEILIKNGACPVSRYFHPSKGEHLLPFQLANDNFKEFLKLEAIRYFAKASEGNESCRREIENLVKEVPLNILTSLQDAAHSMLNHPKIRFSSYELFSDSSPSNPLPNISKSTPFSPGGSGFITNSNSIQNNITAQFPLCKLVSQTVSIEYERGFLISPCDFIINPNIKWLDPSSIYDLNVHPQSGRLSSDSPRASIRFDLTVKEEIKLLSHVFTMSLTYRDSTYTFFFRIRVHPEPIATIPVIKFEQFQHISHLADGVSLMTLDSRKVAVKFYRPDIFSMDPEVTDRAPITRDYVVDVNTLSKLSHPNIIDILGRCTLPLCVILEFIPLGSLGDALRRQELGESGDAHLKFKIVWEIASAMRQVHSLGFIHRDIKPDNVLLVSLDPHQKVNVKLADFGSARSLSSKGDFTVVGSPGFCAPEITAAGSPSYGPSVDVFSFGFLVWFVWKAVIDTGSISPLSLPDDVRPQIDPSWNKTIAKIIQTCWSPSPSQRPTFGEIEPKLLQVLTNIVSSSLEAMKLIETSPKIEENLN